jgi:hypothetical protein
MKEAGAKALLFFMFLLIVTIGSIFAIVVLLHGDSESVVNAFSQIK